MFQEWNGCVRPVTRGPQSGEHDRGDMRVHMFRFVVMGMLVLPGLLLPVESAAADSPPALSSPMDCVNQFDDNPDYVGEGWVDALVSTSNGISLRCGDERSGVVHIAHPESNGTTHPVSAETQNRFLSCFRAIVSSGRSEPDRKFPESRTRYELFYGSDEFQGVPLTKTAALIADNARGFVWTMFTSGSKEFPDGNDWRGCAEGNVA
jgi:hypothetical protein